MNLTADQLLDAVLALPDEERLEVAEAVIFLMSNGFVTGVVLPIDGGGGLV